MTQKEKWLKRYWLTQKGVTWTFIPTWGRFLCRLRYLLRGNEQWLFEEEFGFVILDIDGFKVYNKVRYKFGAQKLRRREADKICIYKAPPLSKEKQARKEEILDKAFEPVDKLIKAVEAAPTPISSNTEHQGF